MVIFGLLLVVLGGLIILSGAFGIGYDRDEKNPARDTTEIIGINVQPEVIFFLGVAAGALILLGIWFMKFGAKQGWKHRQERKRLGELSEKLERVEADRRNEDDDAAS